MCYFFAQVLYRAKKFPLEINTYIWHYLGLMRADSTFSFFHVCLHVNVSLLRVNVSLLHVNVSLLHVNVSLLHDKECGPS